MVVSASFRTSGVTFPNRMGGRRLPSPAREISCVLAMKSLFLCVLPGSGLHKAQLANADLSDCRLVGADLSEAWCTSQSSESADPV
jgi:uncharacterized protein YjbI with pentapeptide repeats